MTAPRSEVHAEHPARRSVAPAVCDGWPGMCAADRDHWHVAASGAAHPLRVAEEKETADSLGLKGVR